MPVVDKATNTEFFPSTIDHRRFLGLTVKDFLIFVSQLLLPLVIGIFTVVITFDQRNENRIQRAEDRLIAEQQRLHDKQLAAEKREADDLNAAIQRNMTRDQRIYEINIEQERYKKENEKYLDALLLSYYNEMGELLQKKQMKNHYHRIRSFSH
ncbi:unnamed protein product [Rotaria sp. Silwood2]|nr:unnamed protein product [Rotaria sp. Silwood2]